MGFKVGPSTDSGRTGIFCIGPDQLDGFLSLPTGFSHARDRAKSYLCTEWKKYHAPSCWSMPAVLAFQVPKSRLDCCGTIGDARKWVIQGMPRKLFDFGPIHVLFDVDEYHAWRRLHRLCDLPWNKECLDNGELCDHSLERLVMCGGKKSDPFYWCRDTTNCFTSCGRVCAFSDLHDTWYESGSRIWRCVHCYEKHFL